MACAEENAFPKLRVLLEAATRERKAMCVLYALDEWLSKMVKELRLENTIEAVLLTKSKAARETFKLPYISRLEDYAGKVFCIAIPVSSHYSAPEKASLPLQKQPSRPRRKR